MVFVDFSLFLAFHIVHDNIDAILVLFIWPQEVLEKASEFTIRQQCGLFWFFGIHLENHIDASADDIVNVCSALVFTEYKALLFAQGADFNDGLDFSHVICEAQICHQAFCVHFNKFLVFINRLDDKSSGAQSIYNFRTLDLIEHNKGSNSGIIPNHI